LIGSHARLTSRDISSCSASCAPAAATAALPRDCLGFRKIYSQTERS